MVFLELETVVDDGMEVELRNASLARVLRPWDQTREEELARDFMEEIRNLKLKEMRTKRKKLSLNWFMLEKCECN